MRRNRICIAYHRLSVRKKPICTRNDCPTGWRNGRGGAFGDGTGWGNGIRGLFEAGTGWGNGKGGAFGSPTDWGNGIRSTCVPI